MLFTILRPSAIGENSSAEQELFLDDQLFYAVRSAADSIEPCIEGFIFMAVFFIPNIYAERIICAQPILNRHSISFH